LVDRYGFVKYSKIYEGNIKDSNTLQKTIEDMRGKESNQEGKELFCCE